MDPFAEILIEGTKYKTDVEKDKGKQPKWNDKFSIPITSAVAKMKIRILDEDVVVDDLVG